MKNVTSIEGSVSLIGIGERLRIGRQVRRMTAVVCVSIMVFFAMALVPSIASADCDDIVVRCYKDFESMRHKGHFIDKFSAGACSTWKSLFFCVPCDSGDTLSARCNRDFPKCEGRCTGVAVL